MRDEEECRGASRDLTAARQVKVRRVFRGSSDNSIGNCAIVDRKVAFNQQINAVVPTGDDPRYLLWMFELARTILHVGINNCLKGILSKSGLAGKMFPFHPLPLQREFAAYVAKVEKMEVVARELVTTADMLYRAKLQEYFG